MRPAVLLALTVVAAAGTAAAADLSGSATAVAAPLTASVALVLANPSLPSARPVAVLAGYGTAAVGGLAAVAVAAPGPPAVAVAAGLSLALMLALKAVHPPALAGGCLLALQPADHGRTVLLLIATAAAMALAIETRGRATGRQPG